MGAARFRGVDEPAHEGLASAARTPARSGAGHRRREAPVTGVAEFSEGSDEAEADEGHGQLQRRQHEAHQ
jgi:hypothetical protein